MTRTILWSLAVAAMLATLVDGAAHAEQSGKRSAARSGHNGGLNATMGDGSVRFLRPGLGSSRRTKFQLTNELQNINARSGKGGKALTGTGPNKASPTLFQKCAQGVHIPCGN